MTDRDHSLTQRRNVRAWNSRRRDFLKLAGASGLLVPFLRPLEAFSQDGQSPPKRIIFWFQPNGVVEDFWFPQGQGGTITEATLSATSLAPLAPWASKINVIDDVELYSSYHEKLKVAPHDAGCCQLWTNQACQPPHAGGSTFDQDGNYDSWTYPKGPSLDQALSDLPAVRGSSPIRSLELGIGVAGSGTLRRMSYTSSGTPVAPENDPEVVFRRAFGTSSAEIGDPEVTARGRRYRQRLLDRVNGDLTSLSTQLGGEDRARLEQYSESLHSLEQELVGVDSSACTLPPSEEAVSQPLDPYNFPAVGRRQLKILASALACDLTRVGSVMWLGSGATNLMTWLGHEGRNQTYHLCSHGQLPGVPAETQRQWLRETDAWFAGELAFFISELERLDPSGALRDSVLIVSGNELRSGYTHSRDRLPLMTFGGSWHFKTGQHSRGDQKRRHGDLLAEVGRAMGADLDTFGAPEFCGGPSLSLTT